MKPSDADLIFQHPNPVREGVSLLQGLLSRRSVSPRRLLKPGPNLSEVRQCVASALTAPDHCRLRPWRFILIDEKSKDQLGELFVQLKLNQKPDLSQFERDREKNRACAVPTLIAVVAKCTQAHPQVPVREQHASVGAAIQNMLLCAHGLGFGAKMVSGRKADDLELAAALGLTANEQLFGFVCIGTIGSDQRNTARPNVADHLTIW